MHMSLTGVGLHHTLLQQQHLLRTQSNDAGTSSAFAATYPCPSSTVLPTTSSALQHCSAAVNAAAPNTHLPQHQVLRHALPHEQSLQLRLPCIILGVVQLQRQRAWVVLAVVKLRAGLLAVAPVIACNAVEACRSFAIWVKLQLGLAAAGL
jgi:hypothetical protein